MIIRYLAYIVIFKLDIYVRALVTNSSRIIIRYSIMRVLAEIRGEKVFCNFSVYTLIINHNQNAIASHYHASQTTTQKYLVLSETNIA